MVLNGSRVVANVVLMSTEKCSSGLVKTCRFFIIVPQNVVTLCPVSTQRRSCAFSVKFTNVPSILCTCYLCHCADNLYTRGCYHRLIEGTLSLVHNEVHRQLSKMMG